MALLPARANVRVLLGRLRPGSEFGWKGGRDNDTTQVRYRDSATIEPTEAEYLAELAVKDAEDATRTATRAAQSTRSVAVVGTASSALTTLAQITPALEQLLLLHDAIDRNGNLRPLRDWRRV